MPTYSYRCASCGHQFDIFQRFSDDPLSECPQCHGQLRKVFHPVGVVFKGTGWYITDSRQSTGSENGAGDKGDKADKADQPDKADKTEAKDGKAAKDGKDGKDAKPSDAAKKSGTAESPKTKTAASSES
jgi:putative FmdB family regulatory protein